MTKMSWEWWVVPGGHRILPISLVGCFFLLWLSGPRSCFAAAFSPAGGLKRTEVMLAAGDSDLREIGPGVREIVDVPADHGKSTTFCSLPGCLW
jgi:hypothetical protein